MTALLLEAVTSDFFYGFISGGMTNFAVVSFFSYRRYKLATLAIRETTAQMRESR